jgi:hypothetical protein
VTALGRPSSTCTSEVQAHTLVREGGPMFKATQMSVDNFRGRESKIGRASQMVA